jgi:eukaryotic-like serine/threonine-protein kinase
MLRNYAFLILFGLVFTFLSCKEETTIPKSSAKAITKLTFPQFTPAVQATIDETTKRITAVVPPTADVTKLIPSISVSLKAKVLPDSGKVQDFTNEVTYTVTAEDGTKVDYKVMVSRTKFSGKDITEFSFADFSPAIVAKIDPTTKTITATVPATADLTKLKPTLKLSDRATVNPASGTVVDFSKAVNFTVTAEDASTQVYAVTVVKENPPVSTGDNSLVFITSEKGIVYALDANTGLKKWQYAMTGTALYANSSPTYENQIVFTNNANGLLYAIDANTGKELWKVQDKSRSLGVTPVSPLVSKGIVYSGGNGLFAYEATTGKSLWTADRSCNTTPALFNDVIYLAGSNNIYTYDAKSGAAKWDQSFLLSSANPAVSGGLIYCATFGRVFSRNISDGSAKWSFTTGSDSNNASPTIADGIAFFSASSTLYALDANTGDLKWKQSGSYGAGPLASSPITDSNNGLVFAASGSLLVAFDAKTGTPKWEVKAGDNLSSPCVANGIVFVAGLDGNLYAFDSKTGAKKWTFATDSKVYSSPCVVDKKGVVYHSAVNGVQN